MVGLSLGVAALTRTTVLSLTVILLLWTRRYRGLRLMSWAAAGLVGVALLVYSPWPVRNSLLLGQVVPGSSESTEWLWRGTNPNATGGSLTPDGQTMLAVAPSDFQARVAAASESARMTIYRDAALQFIGQDPLDAARLYVLKLKAFWWGSAATGLLYPSVWTPIYDAWYVMVIVFAVIGLWCAWRDEGSREIAVLIVASLLLVALTQAMFYVEGRHRLAVEPLVLVLAGIGLAQAAARAHLPRLESQRLRRARDNLT
jgi:hypothetical protein